MSEDNTKKEINIKSTTIEQGIKSVSGFLDKLVSPAIEELGLLLQDKVRYFRLKNQIKILEKAEELITDKNIKVQKIPTKILAPLLDNCSLEEGEVLQNKWTNMLVNMADSEKNFQNNIFPYLLNQISKEEFDGLNKLRIKESSEIPEIIKKYEELRKSEYSNEFGKISRRLIEIEQEGYSIELEPIEIENIKRLGLISQLPPKIRIERKHNGLYGGNRLRASQLGADYDFKDSGFRTTSLGNDFLEVCEIKKSEQF